MNIKELGFSTAIASVCTVMSAALGGWDIALRVLIALMVVDYITGFLGAVKNKKVNSEVMFGGGARKGAILSVIVITVLLDEMVGNQQPILRTLAIYFYAAREGVSLTENLGILGVYLPPGIKKVLEQLQEKGEGK
jgi:toxin secretion/phage lysis holin